MSQYAYERLSHLDRSFLLAENRTHHMHVGCVVICDAGPLRKPHGGIDADRIRDYVEARIERLPRYRQVIARTPIEGFPVWIDDPYFDIQYHVRHVALPRPGGERELKQMSARIMSQQLDRTKPLWELTIVEGLGDGDRFALISKIHHAMIDGASTVDLLTEILTPKPVEAFRKAGLWRPRPAPTPWELFRDEVGRRARVPLEALLHFRSWRAKLADFLAEARADGGLLRWSARRRGGRTPVNQPIGPHRSFDWYRLDLAEVKAVRRALGGTIHDIVLATLTGAVARYLERRGADLTAVQFRVATPVSVMGPDDRGHRLSAWRIELPVADHDPRHRLARIREATARLKESNRALDAALLSRAVRWTPSTLLAVSAREMPRALPVNLVVTNVPGPQQPLYLLGSRMLESYGQVPLADGLGLGIVVFSYAGVLSFGFNSDGDMIPDIDELARATEDAFRELQAAADPSRADAHAEADAA